MSEEVMSLDHIVERWAFDDIGEKELIQLIKNIPQREISQEDLGFLLYAAIVNDSKKVFKMACELGAIVELYHLNYLKEHDLRMRWYKRIKKGIRGFDDTFLEDFRQSVKKRKRFIKHGPTRRVGRPTVEEMLGTRRAINSQRNRKRD